MGTSKYKGLPHLPRGFEWPKGSLFLLQLNLAEVGPFDAQEVFPKSGTLYVFIFGPQNEVTLHHYKGPVSDLKMTRYPAGMRFDEVKTFIGDAGKLTVTPSFTFHVDAQATMKLVPKDLMKKVGEALNAKPSDGGRGFSLLGRPAYEQGEDEDRYGNGDDDAAEEEDTYGMMNGPRGTRRHHVLLLQDSYGEGTIFVWGDPKKTRKGNFSGCWMSYSGT